MLANIKIISNLQILTSQYFFGPWPPFTVYLKVVSSHAKIIETFANYFLKTKAKIDFS